MTKGVTNEVIRTVNEQLHSQPTPFSLSLSLGQKPELTEKCIDYFNAQTPDAHARRTREPIAVPVMNSTNVTSNDYELSEKKKEE